MSLKVFTVERVAKILALTLTLLIAPSFPAQAAIAFDTPVTVNQTATTIPAYTAIQGNIDGSIIVIATNGYLLRSVDSGTTWSALTAAGMKYWNSVAINDSGTVIVAGEILGSIWLSTDSGVTFTQQSNGVNASSNWNSLDTNASGSIIAATNSGSSVFLTTNTGTSWATKSVSGTSGNRSVVLSATGDRIAVFSGGNQTLYTSSNSGTSWNAQTAAGTISSSATTVVLSRDGQGILFMRQGAAYISKSINFGSTWETITTPTASSIAFTASDDLSSIWFGSNGGASYYSTNSGANWGTTSQTGTWKYLYINPAATQWTALINSAGIFRSSGVPSTLSYAPVNVGASSWAKAAMSSNGAVQVVSSLGSDISISTDSGATWNPISALGRSSAWNCLAISGNGNAIYVGGYGIGLRKSTDQGATWNYVGGGSLTGSTINILGCATNNDGSKIAAIQDSTGIHYSTNGGSSFILSQSHSICTSTNKFAYITMASNGSKMAGVCSAGNTRVVVTSNSGSTWETTSATSTTFFRDIKSAADGSVLITTAGGFNAPFISRDWGATWFNATGIGVDYLGGVSISDNGELILLGKSSSSGGTYYSVDKGATFTLVPGLSVGSYGAVAISGDTTKALFGADGRQLKLMGVTLTSNVLSFSSLALNAPAAFRSQRTLTATIATAGADGKVTFFANGKRIAGCIKVQTVSLVATCSWKATSRGAVTLSATAYPADTNFPSGSTSLSVTVTNRSGNR
jgi:photosystem II stability/assembly factor-like uncharacterized protein